MSKWPLSQHYANQHHYGHTSFALPHAVCEDFSHSGPSCHCTSVRVVPGKGLRRMEIWLRQDAALKIPRSSIGIAQLFHLLDEKERVRASLKTQSSRINTRVRSIDYARKSAAESAEKRRQKPAQKKGHRPSRAAIHFSIAKRGMQGQRSNCPTAATQGRGSAGVKYNLDRNPPPLGLSTECKGNLAVLRRTDRRIEKIDSSFTGHSYSIRLRQWTRVCGRQTRGILLVEFNYDSNRCSLYHKRSAGLLRSLLPFDCKLPRSDSGRISSDALDRRLDLSSQQFLKSGFRLTHPCASKQADPAPLAGICSSTASPPPRPPAPRPSRGCPPAVTSLHRLGQ